MDKSNSISDERLRLHSLYYPSKDLDGLFEAASKYLKELENYKKQEEDGLVLRLPCKVGDASPTKTLYLVFEDSEWPDKIAIGDADEFLTKDELKKIRKWFLKKCGPFNDET